jgi:hypothetical protein
MVLHRVYTETVNVAKRDFPEDHLVAMIIAAKYEYEDSRSLEGVGWPSACLRIWAKEYWEMGGIDELERIQEYVKIEPTIIADMKEMKKEIEVSIELQLMHKRAVKSATAAQARMHTENARRIVDKIVG